MCTIHNLNCRGWSLHVRRVESLSASHNIIANSDFPYVISSRQVANNTGLVVVEMQDAVIANNVNSATAGLNFKSNTDSVDPKEPLGVARQSQYLDAMKSIQEECSLYKS